MQVTGFLNLILMCMQNTIHKLRSQKHMKIYNVLPYIWNNTLLQKDNMMDIQGWVIEKYNNTYVQEENMFSSGRYFSFIC